MGSRLQVELEVKRSKFIAYASPAQTADEAMAFFEEVRDHSASHNCFAYKAAGDTHRRFSDDGEPSGSAGRPIMGAVDGSGLDNVAVLVARYFGGVKLGVGGLVRAYGGAASAVLQEAQTHEVGGAACRSMSPPGCTWSNLVRPFAA